MKVLDFTKETDELENKLIKLGFHYQSTDKEPDSLGRPPRLINTWANVMIDVTCKSSIRMTHTVAQTTN